MSGTRQTDTADKADERKCRDPFLGLSLPIPAPSLNSPSSILRTSEFFACREDRTRRFDLASGLSAKPPFQLRMAAPPPGPYSRSAARLWGIYPTLDAMRLSRRSLPAH